MTPITSRTYGALVYVRARAGAIRQGRIDLLAGESKKEGMWGGDISIYRWLVANAMVGWCFARQERTNIRSLRAPDRYITFSSETGWEMEWSEQESARGREDVRLDGRQFVRVGRLGRCRQGLFPHVRIRKTVSSLDRSQTRRRRARKYPCPSVRASVRVRLA